MVLSQYSGKRKCIFIQNLSAFSYWFSVPLNSTVFQTCPGTHGELRCAVITVWENKQLKYCKASLQWHWEHQFPKVWNAWRSSCPALCCVSEQHCTTIKAFSNKTKLNMDAFLMCWLWAVIYSSLVSKTYPKETRPLSNPNAFRIPEALPRRPAEGDADLWRSKVNMQAFQKQSCGCNSCQKSPFLWERGCGSSWCSSNTPVKFMKVLWAFLLREQTESITCGCLKIHNEGFNHLNALP